MTGADYPMVQRALWLGFLLRVGVAFWNGFFGPSFGADADAYDQHMLALDFMQGIWPANMRVNYLYSYALAAIYSATVTSLFIGSLLSCIAWYVSAWSLAVSMRLLRMPSRSQTIAMLIFALTPSAVLWTAVTMREPFQLMCVNLAVLSALQIGIASRARYWGLMFASLVLGGIMHGGILGWGVLLIASTIVWEMVKHRRWFTPLRVLAGVAVIVGVLVAGYQAFRAAYAFPVDRGLAYAVDSYQRGGLSIGVRADYRTTVDIESNSDLLAFIPVALFQYLFEPLPWHVTSLVDLAPLTENVVRAVLLLQALVAVLILRPIPRRAALVLCTSYLVLETAWALGTFNWGTAARHHIPGLGLLLLAAYAYPRLPRRQGGSFDARPPVPLGRVA